MYTTKTVAKDGHQMLIHTMRSTGRVTDAFASCPSFFEGKSLLLVCIDSERSLGPIAQEFQNLGFPCTSLGERIWVDSEHISKLLTMNRHLHGFDAMYVFSEMPCQGIPEFDATTEAEEAFELPYLADLARDLHASGAHSYLADGCGLVAVSRDYAWTAELNAVLEGSITSIHI